MFTANPGGILDSDGKLVPEAREAQDRGVWFDTAHGRMNFSFEVGEKILDQGMTPHCISTDLTLPGRARTVHSMTEMMSRFLAMGFTLDQVVTMTTLNPAKSVGIDDRLGSLAVGKQRRRLGSLRHRRWLPQVRQSGGAGVDGEEGRGF